MNQILPKNRLESLFQKKNPPLTLAEAKVEANRCIFCFDAPCIKACPTQINIPQFIKRIADGNTKGAAETILDSNVLGYSCSVVCPVEVLCVGSCVYNQMQNPPIPIGRLQEFALRQVPENSRYGSYATKVNKKVALVGAGPASLACAAYLALSGVETEIFEAASLPGGLNTYGVAPYKLLADESLREIKRIEDLGVKIHCNSAMGKTISMEKLRKGYDAVFLGVGLGADHFVLNAQGLKNVWGATEWIAKMKTAGAGPMNLERPLVIGGGNTALDVAHELSVLLKKPVTLAYRRTEQEMSGYAFELKAARAVGTLFLAEHRPKELLIENDSCFGVSFDTPKGLVEIKVDGVFFATGQAKVNFKDWLPDLALGGDGCIKVDPATGETNLKGVFAGGDAVNGGKEVVNAVEEGKRAAFTLLKSFQIRRAYGRFTY